MLFKKYRFLIFAIVIIVVLALIYFLKVLPSPEETSKEAEQQQEKAQEKTEQEWPGEYSFNVSSGEGYPKFISGKFSKRPMDIETGETLTSSIKAEDPAGISKVRLVIVGQKESLKQEIELELIEGDEFLGVWQGNLTIPGETTLISRTIFYIENKLGKEEDLDLMW